MRRYYLLVMLLFVLGCGYHSTLRSDKDIKTITVPVFDNKTRWREIEFELTNLVHRDIKGCSSLQMVSRPEDADIIVKGEITDYYKPVLVEDGQDNVVAAAARITVTVSVIDQKTGKPILTQTRAVQGQFIKGANDDQLDAEYRGRQSAFEQITRWIVSLLEEL